MALPIKDTPVLTGESAERFLRLMEENKGKRISAEKRKQMRENYEKIMRNAKL